MKVLTLNTWGTHGPTTRPAILLQAIRSLDPDILSLQEVADDTLLVSLGYPTCLHEPGSELAILSRLPLVKEEILTFSVVSPLESHRRQALLAELDLGSESLWIVTTHLAWKAEDEATRAYQVEELLQRVAPLGSRLLLSGDMNAEPDHPPVRRIRENGFCDLFAKLHPEEPGITWDNKNPLIQSHKVRFPDRRIDYLFLHEKTLSGWKPIRCDVVCRTPTADGDYPSDHYGVLCDLERTRSR